MDSFFDVLPAILALSIPIVAIIGSYYIKGKEMKYKYMGRDDNEINEIKKNIDSLINENADLKNRISNLELCLLEDDEKIKIEEAHKLKINQEK